MRGGKTGSKREEDGTDGQMNGEEACWRAVTGEICLTHRRSDITEQQKSVIPSKSAWLSMSGVVMDTAIYTREPVRRQVKDRGRARGADRQRGS